MSKPRIIILYKDKSYKVIKEREIYRYFDPNKIKCLLFPKLDNPTIFYPILPDNRLLSFHFNVEITFDIGEFDFDNNWFEYKDTFTGHFESESLLQFINYISVFYQNEGIASLLESSYLNDGFSVMRYIYPTHYHIEFNYGESVIDSGQLKRKTNSGELNISSYNWIIEDRMSSISDILFTVDSIKNCSHKLPIFLGLRDGIWAKSNYSNNLNNLNLNKDDLILVKLEEFNSYYLLPYHVCNQLMHIETFNMGLALIDPEVINNRLYYNFASNIMSEGQIERDALYRYIISEYFSNTHFEFNLGDLYCDLIWLVYSKEITNYILALYKTDVNNPLVLIRHNGKMFNTVFTYDEIQKNDFAMHLSKYINRRMK